jgi:hydrogenase-4 component B
MNMTLAAFSLVLVPTLPLILLLLWCVPALRPRVELLTPWAAVPALLLALLAETGVRVELEWLLFGSVLAMDSLTRVFLAFTALLWLGAGIFSHGTLVNDERAGSFRLAWLATMAGNFTLLLALDVVTFYAGFALMTFAAYGLIIHSRSVEALYAGRIYLIMAVLGEGLIIAGLLFAASRSAAPLAVMLADIPGAVADAPDRDLIMACLLLGFGVKAGLPLLHMWLPLAHPAAPVPASAVLSGAMIKAGLLGWLSTLPIGLIALPQWGLGVMAAGFVAAFGGALLGVHQRTAKTVLAYSSISQMGLITVIIGAGLYQPCLWPALAPALALYAFHHGLAKGALFLGVGVANQGAAKWRSGLWLALALPGLSLAGLMVSGAVAKVSFKTVLEAGIETPIWWQYLPLLLSLATIGTTTLIARYLWLLYQSESHTRVYGSQWLGWGLLLAASMGGLVLLPWVPTISEIPPSPIYLPGLIWPVLVGMVLAVVAARYLRPWPLPEGDLIVLFRFSADGGLRLYPHRVLSMMATVANQMRPTRQQRKPPETDTRLERSDLEYLLRRNTALVFSSLLAAGIMALLFDFW